MKKQGGMSKEHKLNLRYLSLNILKDVIIKKYIVEISQEIGSKVNSGQGET